ncbi:MAG TPA: hypothetical protein VF316_13425 [Polyangiaceae bacterium]
MSWPKEDMFAITIDGRVLMNARALDDVDLAELATQKGVFVGVVLSKGEVRKLSLRMHDASSEAAAFISGGRPRKKGHRSGSR